MGLNSTQSGIHFTRVVISNEIDQTDYGDFGAGYQCLTEETANQTDNTPKVPFSVDIELLDSEKIKHSLLKSNPKEELGKGRHFGPGFPSIMVGPNGGGKSVSISMIQAFIEFVEEVAPLFISTRRHNMHFGVSDMGSVWETFLELESSNGELPRISSEELMEILNRFNWLGNAWKCEFSMVFSSVENDVESKLGLKESRVVMEVRRSPEDLPDSEKLEQVKISYDLNPGSLDRGGESDYVMILIDQHRNYARDGLRSNYGGLVCAFPSSIYRSNSGVGDNFLPIKNERIAHKGTTLSDTVGVFLKMSHVLDEAIETYDSFSFEGYGASEDNNLDMEHDYDMAELIVESDLDYLWLVTSGRLNHEGDDQQRKSDAIECLDDLVRTLFLDSEEVGVGWKGLLVDTQRRDRETGKLKSPSNRTAVSIGRSIQSSMDIVKRKLDKPTKIASFEDESLNARRLNLSRSELAKLDLANYSKKVNEWMRREFNPKSGDRFLFPASPSNSKEYAAYPPFKLYPTIEETILENRLIVAIDEHQVRIPEGSDRRKVESFLYDEGEESAWFVTLQESALSEAYKLVYEWKENKRTMREIAETLDALDKFSLELDTRQEKNGFYSIIRAIMESHQRLNNPTIPEGLIVPTIQPVTMPGRKKSDVKKSDSIKSIQRDHSVTGKVTQAALNDETVRKIWEKEREEGIITNWFESKHKKEIIAKVRELIAMKKYSEESVEDHLDFDDVLYSFISGALNALTEFASISSRISTLNSKMSEFLGFEVSIKTDRFSDFPDMYADLDDSQLDGVRLSLGVPYLSSGQAQLFTILTEMVTAPPTVRHVLIDEPELSLHDKFVADLYEYMCEYSKSTGKQVICSTHSTTLAGLGLSHSVFVEKQGGKNE